MEIKIKEKKIKYCTPMLNGEPIVITIDKLSIIGNDSKIALKMYSESDEAKEGGFIYGAKDNYLTVDITAINPFSTDFLILVKAALKAKYALINSDFE